MHRRIASMARRWNREEEGGGLWTVVRCVGIVVKKPPAISVILSSSLALPVTCCAMPARVMDEWMDLCGPHLKRSLEEYPILSRRNVLDRILLLLAAPAAGIHTSASAFVHEVGILHEVACSLCRIRLCSVWDDHPTDDRITLRTTPVSA